MSQWTVEPITKKQADFIVTRRHYSRRAPIFWEAFALVDGDGLVDGVVVYGQPSPPIQKHAFADRDFRLYELTRLVIQTTKPNAASFLVGRSLRMLSEQPSAVVSYADTDWGHAGVVYQATNWLYTGATGSGTGAYIFNGEKIHPTAVVSRFGATDHGRWAKENGAQVIPASKKHRYFYLNGTARQKKEMCSKLRYPVINEYPKSEKRMYDAGEHVLLSVHDREADMFGGLC